MSSEISKKDADRFLTPTVQLSAAILTLCDCVDKNLPLTQEPYDVYKDYLWTLVNDAKERR